MEGEANFLAIVQRLKNNIFILLFYFIAFSAIIKFSFYLFDILLVLSDKNRGF